MADTTKPLQEAPEHQQEAPETHTCPVCEFTGMERPADFGEICPCCGTQFGVSDDDMPHEELRRKWVEGGAKWRDRVIPEPQGRSEGEALTSFTTRHPLIFRNRGINYGEPTVKGCEIKAEALWRPWRLGDPKPVVASWFNVTLEQVEAAIAWCEEFPPEEQEDE